MNEKLHPLTGAVYLHVLSVATCSSSSGIVLSAIPFSYKSTLDTIEKKLKKELANCGTWAGDTVKVNDVVAVRLGVQWYRALIIGFQRNETAVELVDVGRREMVRKDELRPIPESLLLFPRLAIKVVVARNFLELTRARTVVESLVLGAKTEVTVESRGKEGEFYATFGAKLSDAIDAKLEEERKPYTGMDPFNTKPRRNSKTQRGSSSSNDSGNGSQRSAGGSGTFRVPLPSVIAGESSRFEVEFESYGEGAEFCLVLTQQKPTHADLQRALDAYCARAQCVEDLRNVSALYAVKLPRGEWVRATIVECLTAADAEMELIDRAGQFRRCNIEHIVQLPTDTSPT